MALWGKEKNNSKEIETREGRKAGFIRGTLRKFKNIDWKNPVNRWKFLFVALVFCIVVFGGGYGVLSYTNSPTFCSNCHEMQPEYSTFTASSHNEISCVQCHIKPGFTNMITHKMKSMKEVYYHVTGVPEQIVQTEAVANENCLQCHSKNRLVTASGDLKVNHKGHIEKDIPCITCHAGVVHAKMAARGINVDEDRGEWTKENAEKLIEEKYLKPNMGTCIDCHDKVNKGEKPWKEEAYSLPENPEETKTVANGSAEVASTEATNQNAVEDQKTQDIILQAIGKEKANVKISMECTTCHSQVKVPVSHKTTDWNHNHGATAINKLDTCVNCHQDSKWSKAIPKEDIMSILKMGSKKVKYTPNIKTVEEQARINKFCSACHSKRPEGHLSSDKWLTQHAKHAETDAEKSQCFVCHDKEKPKSNSTEAKSPTDVYCAYCHRSGFKSGK